MKIMNLIIVATFSLCLVACGGGGWTDDQKAEYTKACTKDNLVSEKACDCQFELMDLTYEDWKNPPAADENAEEPTDAEKEEAEALAAKIVKCVTDNPVAEEEAPANNEEAPANNEEAPATTNEEAPADNS